jgi:hypothetical protein
MRATLAVGAFVIASAARDVGRRNRGPVAPGPDRHVEVEHHQPSAAPDPTTKPIKRRAKRELSDSALARALAEDDEAQAVNYGEQSGGGGRLQLTDSAIARQLAAEDEFEAATFNDDSSGTYPYSPSREPEAVVVALDAHRLHDFVVPRRAGITVSCPYLSCTNGHNVAMERFVDHVNNNHPHASHHKYACPICTLANVRQHTPVICIAQCKG